MKKRIVLTSAFVTQCLLSSAVYATPSIEEKAKKDLPFERDTLSVQLNGDQYQSAFQIDLSDPNLILTIDTDLLPQEDIDALLPELGETDKATTINEAKSLALRVKAKEKATKGDYTGALALLNEAEGLTANPAKVLSMKGSVQYKLNQVELAIVSWKKALKLDPSLTDVSDMIKWLEK